MASRRMSGDFCKGIVLSLKNNHSVVLDPLRRLAPVLAPHGVGISGLRRLTGGASKETWAFDLEVGVRKIPLILRRLRDHAALHETQMELAAEAAVITAAKQDGVKVPTVRYVLRNEDDLGQGFIMDHVDGETIPRKILRDLQFDAVRPRLAYQFGVELARIHRVDSAGLPALRHCPGSSALADLRRDLDRSATPRPVFELALQWLQNNQPSDPAKATLVHGDFRNGNILISPDGIEAVLDWELAHLGDPMEDLGWLFMTPWRFGMIELPAGGLGTRDQVFQGYEDAGGTIDAGAVRFWEVAGSLRWGMNCDYALSLFEAAADSKDVEQAMIARRLSETEIDLLRILSFEA